MSNVMVRKKAVRTDGKGDIHVCKAEKRQEQSCTAISNEWSSDTEGWVDFMTTSHTCCTAIHEDAYEDRSAWIICDMVDPAGFRNSRSLEYAKGTF